MNTETKRKKFPWVMIIITVAVASTLLVARKFDISMSDTVFHFDYALLNIATMISIPVLFVAWLVWLAFFSRWPKLYSRIIPLIFAVSAIGFLGMFQPRMDGSLAIIRWEPRFWAAPTVKMASEETTIDLGESTILDFPQFLGPNRTGRVPAGNIRFEKLNGQCELVWKKPMGAGWSGFVVSDGFAFSMAQELGEELVVCMDVNTGDTKWIYRHARRHDDPLGGVGPRGTPTIHEGKIYAIGANGLFVCLDASNGDVVWQVDIPKMLGITMVKRDTPNGTRQVEETTTTWGRSASPLIYEDKVIVPGGGPKTRTPVSLIAFDKKNGNEIWRGGEHGISYASPTVINLHGSDQIVVTNESSVAGHDPETGEELWNHPWPGHSDSDANCSQPTDVGNNRILISKGYGIGAELFEVIDQEESGFKTKSLWKNQRVLKTKMTNPVVNGKYAYGLSDRILECVDLEKGERVWKNGRYGHGQLLLVGDHLLIHGEKGFLALVSASPDKYEELGRVDTIDGICWNTLCVYDQFVLVRSDQEAACYRIKSSGSE